MHLIRVEAPNPVIRAPAPRFGRDSFFTGASEDGTESWGMKLILMIGAWRHHTEASAQYEADRQPIKQHCRTVYANVKSKTSARWVYRGKFCLSQSCHHTSPSLPVQTDIV